MARISLFLVIFSTLCTSLSSQQTRNLKEIKKPITLKRWYPPNNLTLRNGMARAAKILANFLHIRFHKRQIVKSHTERNAEENFVFNPVEISCLLGMVMNGMRNVSQMDQIYEFLGYRKAGISSRDMLTAMEQYMYHEQYDLFYERSRVVHIEHGIFTNRNFSLFENYISEMKIKYKGEFRNMSRNAPNSIVEEIENYVKKKTFGMITSIKRKNRSEFDMMMVETTFISGRWHAHMKRDTDKSRWFYCINGKKKYKMRKNSKVFLTYYLDLPDRFAIIIPIKNGGMGLLFYVPKTHELFQHLDKHMDYKQWSKVREKVIKNEMVQVYVTFPLFQMNYSRNIKYDMRINGVTSIFTTDGIIYNKMTSIKRLYINEIFQRSFITMDDDNLHFASVTYLTFFRNRRLAQRKSHLKKKLSNYSAQCLKSNDQKTNHLKNSCASKKCKGKTTEDGIKQLIAPTKKRVNYKTSSDTKSPRILNESPKSVPYEQTSANIRKSSGNSFSKAKTTPSDFQPRTDLPFHPTKKLPCFTRSTKAPCTESESFEECKTSTVFSSKPITKCKAIVINQQISEQKKFIQLWSNPIPSRWGEITRTFEYPPTSTTIIITRRTPPPKPIYYVVIDTSFFYAIIARDNELFFSIGKAFYCPDEPSEA